MYIDCQTLEHVAKGLEIEKFRWPFTQDECCLS